LLDAGVSQGIGKFLREFGNTSLPELFKLIAGCGLSNAR